MIILVKLLLIPFLFWSCAHTISEQKREISFSGPALEVPQYYGDDFHQLLEKQNQKTFREKLRDVLTATHYFQGEKKADKIDDQPCPSDAGNRITRNTHEIRSKDVGACYRHRTKNYGEARDYLFSLIDNLGGERGGKVRSVYCNLEYYMDDIRKPAKVGTTARPADDKFLNTEHTLPKGQFKREPIGKDVKQDLHHLYITDTQANQDRSNHPFGNVVKDKGVRTKKGQACTTSKLGPAYEFALVEHENIKDIIKNEKNLKGSLATSLYFEPPLEHKGNVARALFYMSLRYEIPMNDTEETYLRAWHEQDPVDENEIKRNELILEIQGNRNPFIDFPDFVERIDNF